MTTMKTINTSSTILEVMSVLVLHYKLLTLHSIVNFFILNILIYNSFAQIVGL